MKFLASLPHFPGYSFFITKPLLIGVLAVPLLIEVLTVMEGEASMLQAWQGATNQLCKNT